MKKFTIKSSLACGLTHRLNTLDPQVVIDACGIDAIESIRANQRIIKKIVESNGEFEMAVAETEKKKRAVLEEMQAEYKLLPVEMTVEEKAAKARDLTAKFNEKAAEIQKESVANPETLIAVEVSDEDYKKTLMPVFKKTAQLWDVEGNGGGQKLFLEVADALSTVSDC